jgi:SAM-dependent methyltransferase
MEEANHFSNIDYDNELPKHMTEYYVARKCGKMFVAFFSHHKPPMVDPERTGFSGIDLGCGVGHHVKWFNWYDYFIVIGIDKATNDSYECMDGDIRDIRLKPDKDFAYTINVLHHLPSQEDQVKAMKEAARILKKGGLYFIHELSFRNPLIGLYVKHIFRHFRNIDQGSETWFDKRLFEQVPELKLIKTEYFTFTPDFCPKWLLPLFRKIDKWTDGKWIARFGAHVMFVLEKA